MEVQNATSPNSNSETTWGSDIKSKWKRRSKLEQQLLVALIIVVLILTGLLLFIIIKHAVAPRKCKTPACLLAASRITTHIDPKVDPCDDFFQFACGKFIESSHGDIKAATIPKLKAQVERQLMEIIKEPIEEDDYYLLKHQKEMFQACMNESAVEEESFDIFKKTLDELQGWPVAVGYRWDDRIFDWKELVYALRDHGYAYGMIMEISVVPDPINNDRYIVQIDLPHVAKVKYEHKQPYIKYMTDIAVIFGADRNRALLEMERVFDFMENLRKVVDKHSDGEEEGNKTAEILERRFTVPEYEAQNHQIHWLEFINRILYPVGQISNDDYVLFPASEFVKDLFDLLYKTQRRIQANYIIWKAIENIMPYMTKDMKERNSNYTCRTNTSLKTKDRSQFCQQKVKRSFRPPPSDIIYARRYLPKDQRTQVIRLVENIKAEFKTLLKETSWMDAVTTQKALEKADAIIEIIGAPRDYFSDASFEQFPPGNNFEENIQNGSFFEMILSHTKRRNDAHYFHIHMSVNETKPEKFYDYVSYVDAMYSPPDNAMILPVGILQDIFYDGERPMYLNYGAIGGIIGHELTHGFGKMGSKYDKNGNLHTMWTQKTKKAFKEKVQCVIDEAESFELAGTDEKINGTFTLEENIADYTGLKVAYAAYKKWVHQNGEEPYLTGIEYTPSQLFWISSISYECFKLDAKGSLKPDRHADSSFRGTAPMRNNPDFGKDFNCPTGSKMNPPQKCQVF